ncbi:MAG: GGDEF domain-containing response regulator [Deltaproteobacteria bacterium]|nr:GGDEF domain-containing response regulator [Deltaproteobacteria bacterium]
MSGPDRKRSAPVETRGEGLEEVSGKGARALIASADERAAEGLSRLLRALGWTPIVAECDDAALRAVERSQPTVVIARFEKQELTLAERLRSLYPLMPVVAVLPKPNFDQAAMAYEAGATVCIGDPVTEPALRGALRRAERRLRQVAAERVESLRLVDSARALNASLLFSDIYPLTLDTMMRETGSNAAVGIFADAERGVLGLRAMRGMSAEMAEHLAHRLTPMLEGRLSSNARPIDDTIDPDLWTSLSDVLKGEIDEPPRLLLVPVPRASRGREASTSPNIGAVLLLRHAPAAPFSQDLRERAAFLAVQAGIAVQNGALYAAAEERAYLDPLTGLYNTRYLYATLEQEITRSTRYGHELSVLFLDLDHFKLVNDRHNHLVGSAVLVETAHLIERKIRQVDGAVRYGGDEFVIILIETTHAGALNVAERIRESVGEHVFQEAAGLSIRVTCSIGVASLPVHGKQARELIEAADLAMYRAKSQRNLVRSASD